MRRCRSLLDCQQLLSLPSQWAESTGTLVPWVHTFTAITRRPTSSIQVVVHQRRFAPFAWCTRHICCQPARDLQWCTWQQHYNSHLINKRCEDAIINTREAPCCRSVVAFTCTCNDQQVVHMNHDAPSASAASKMPSCIMHTRIQYS